MIIAANSMSLSKSKNSSLRNGQLNDNAPSVSSRLSVLPFYSRVPKEPGRNLDYRMRLLDLATKSEDVRQQLWCMSSRDPLFFINSFCYVYEPRSSAILPFLTWDFQDRCILLLEEAIGKQDLGMEKSRDMGATWIVLTTFFWKWMFRRRQAYGLVSRNEDAVDKKDDPDCLMWKLDFLLENLPQWMRPSTERSRLSIKNNNNQSTIMGYSATGDVARGGRKTAFMMDEAAAFAINDGFAAWASTQHVTNSRMMVSTPKGLAGVFSEQMRKPDAAMTKISLHWSEHPEKRVGLYTSYREKDEAGAPYFLQILDESYKFPPDYPFILDGKIRSPWYDRECQRHPIPALIAQELDIDYGGSGFPFFNAQVLDQHSREFGRDPFREGEIDYDADTYEPTWREIPGGRLKLWFHPTIDGGPSGNHDYVIGCDVATGVGGDMSSNSVAVVCDQDTGEKVAEWTSNATPPHQFADFVLSLRKWFRGPSGEAFVGWEGNGAGGQFGKHFTERSESRIYYRENEKVVSGKRTRIPGWWSSRDTKRILLGEYAKALELRKFCNHSRPALEEALHYIFLPNGAIEHDRAQSTLDPTASGENHGDRVIADAVAWRLIRDAPSQAKEVQARRPPYGSMAWRAEQARLESLKKRDRWM